MYWWIQLLVWLVSSGHPYFCVRWLLIQHQSGHSHCQRKKQTKSEQWRSCEKCQINCSWLQSKPLVLLPLFHRSVRASFLFNYWHKLRVRSPNEDTFWGKILIRPNWTHAVHFVPHYFSSATRVPLIYWPIIKPYNAVYIVSGAQLLCDSIHQPAHSTQQVIVEPLPRDSMTLYQTAAEQVTPTLGMRGGMLLWSICPDIWRAGGQHNGGRR